MTKLYRATVGFYCPADPEAWKKNKAALKEKDPEKRATLKEQVKKMYVKQGEKVTPYNDEILASWLENECVEEVTG